MSRKSNIRLLIQSTVFFRAVLAIARLLLANKKKSFNYKINKSPLDDYSQSGLDRFVFTCIESVSGSEPYSSLDANVYNVDESRMNGAPLKLSKNCVAKTLKNATPGSRDISLILDSETKASHADDIHGNYILSPLQTFYSGELSVSSIVDINAHFSISFASTAQHSSGTTEPLLAAAQTSFTPFKANRSPPY